MLKWHFRFLLAILHFDSLLDKNTKKKVESALSRLLKGSEALSQAYDEAISRIDSQLPGTKTLAKSVLSWITYAQIPLTIRELCHALAVEPGDDELDVDNIPDIEDIVSACVGLVTVDQESDIIRLVHYTTQEYFERIRESWIPTAQRDIASTCLTYLSFSTFQSGGCLTDEEYEDRVEQNPLISYAARFWSYHARTVQQDISKQALSMLKDRNLVSCSTQVMTVSKRSYKYFGYSQVYLKRTTGLHLMARLGLLHFSHSLLYMSGKGNTGTVDVDSKDGYGQTPLSWAAKEGHEAVVNLLLDTGKVNINLEDSEGRTPLSWAAGNGHKAVVKLLLKTGKVEADLKDNKGKTPLSWAAGNGHEAVVKLLIETGKVDVDLKDSEYGQTPLSWAAENGHEAVAKLLLDTGKVNVNSEDNKGNTPLSWAAGSGHEAVVKLLIEIGKVNVDLKDSEYGQTPLSWATENGHEAVAKLLLDTGKVDVNSKDKEGGTPLSWATERRHGAVVKLLQSYINPS